MRKRLPWPCREWSCVPSCPPAQRRSASFPAGWPPEVRDPRGRYRLVSGARARAFHLQSRRLARSMAMVPSLVTSPGDDKPGNLADDQEEQDHPEQWILNDLDQQADEFARWVEATSRRDRLGVGRRRRRHRPGSRGVAAVLNEGYSGVVEAQRHSARCRDNVKPFHAGDREVHATVLADADIKRFGDHLDNRLLQFVQGSRGILATVCCGRGGGSDSTRRGSRGAPLKRTIGNRASQAGQGIGVVDTARDGADIDTGLQPGERRNRQIAAARQRVRQDGRTIVVAGRRGRKATNPLACRRRLARQGGCVGNPVGRSSHIGLFGIDLQRPLIRNDWVCQDLAGDQYRRQQPQPEAPAERA